MSKTPLIATIRRLFREHRAARRSHVSVAAMRESQAERVERARASGNPVGRRAFLGAAGAGGLALALPRRALASCQPDIAIVGGGIAGLSCALALRDAGVSSTVYEASSRVGGRMHSNNKGYFGNQVTEWCGEFIDPGHTTIQSLAARYDLALDDLVAAQPPGTTDTYKFFGSYYPLAQADIDFAPVFDAVAADQDAAPFPTLFDNHTAAAEALDQMSVYDWIESRVPGGHASPMGALLDVAYTIEYGADATDQSALNLIYLLAFQEDPDQFAVFGESAMQYRIHGGNELLPQAIAADLGVGSTIQLGHSLVKIRKTPAGRYELTFKKSGCTVVKTVDYVVLALPFAVLRNLDYAAADFDALKHTAIQELGRGHSGKTQLQFTQRVWNGLGPWPGQSTGFSFSDTGYQESVDVSRAQPGPYGILDAYSGGSITDALVGPAFANMPHPAVTADALVMLARLEQVYPSLAAHWNGRACQSLPHKSHYLKLGYSYYRTGQYTTFCGHEGARQGGVLFAGEHTSVDYQGYMEGAAVTGQAAAAELLTLV